MCRVRSRRTLRVVSRRPILFCVGLCRVRGLPALLGNVLRLRFLNAVLRVQMFPVRRVRELRAPRRVGGVRRLPVVRCANGGMQGHQRRRGRIRRGASVFVVGKRVGVVVGVRNMSILRRRPMLLRPPNDGYDKQPELRERSVLLRGTPPRVYGYGGLVRCQRRIRVDVQRVLRFERLPGGVRVHGRPEHPGRQQQQFVWLVGGGTLGVERDMRAGSLYLSHSFSPSGAPLKPTFVFFSVVVYVVLPFALLPPAWRYHSFP